MNGPEGTQIGHGVGRHVRQRVYGTPVDDVTASAALASRLASWGWRLDGICASDPAGGASWFAPEGSWAIRTAQRACGSCPVRRECLASALWFGDEYGVWGGATPSQRAALMDRLGRGESLDHVVGWDRSVIRDATA